MVNDLVDHWKIVIICLANKQKVSCMAWLTAVPNANTQYIRSTAWFTSANDVCQTAEKETAIGDTSPTLSSQNEKYDMITHTYNYKCPFVVHRILKLVKFRHVHTVIMSC